MDTTENPWPAEIRRRRVTLGLSMRELADRSHVDRSTLARLESGRPMQPVIIARITQALDALEQEMTGGADDVTVKVELADGTKVTFAGPSADIDALQAAVARLLNEVKEDPEVP